MIRTQGWQQRLYAVTVAAMGKPHAWGSHDCATFAADCVEAMTGSDPMADLRGAYDSALSAARAILAAGADSLDDLAALRMPEIAVSEARRGDVVFCDGPNGGFLGIMQGRSVVGPAQFGLVHVPVAQARRAYRVGV